MEPNTATEVKSRTESEAESLSISRDGTCDSGSLEAASSASSTNNRPEDRLEQFADAFSHLKTREDPHSDEVLNQYMIKNIDTGESLPMSKADEVLKKCINPLNLHIMKLTNDYESDADDVRSHSSVEGLENDYDSIESETTGPSKSDEEKTRHKMGKKAVKSLKRVGKFGKGVIQNVKQGVEKHRQQKEAVAEQQALNQAEVHQTFRLKVNKKGSADFEGLKLVQELQDCRGAIWCMKWSPDGQLLAVAGQDQLLRVYCCSKAWKYFTQLRSKASGQQTSPCSTRDRASLSGSRSNSMSSCDNLSLEGNAFNPTAGNSRVWSEDNTLSEEGPLLLFSAYRGHTADVLDISWSKNHFLLSSSMDKTVRLWHVTRIECLCTLRHADFVTTIQFHPRDDRYFLSGSLDGKLRLWNIPDKKVTLWNEVMALPNQQSGSSKGRQDLESHGLITASAFVQNGKFAVIGTYDGRVIFFSTDQLKYFTQLDVSAKGIIAQSVAEVTPGTFRNRRRKKCNKVTGIEGVDDNKILVTTNDSRIRLYDLRDLSLACKYKGCVNVSSQIRASVSHDNKYIVCGSENSSFYIWRLQENTAIGQRRDKNNLWEAVRILSSTTPAPEALGASATPASSRPVTTSPGIITSATFAPSPKTLDVEANYVIAAADFTGTIRLFSK